MGPPITKTARIERIFADQLPLLLGFQIRVNPPNQRKSAAHSQFANGSLGFAATTLPSPSLVDAIFSLLVSTSRLC